MARQDLNEALAQTSFLFGGNAAYIEDLYAQYAKDPNSVDAEWQAFFGALKDDDRIVTKNAEGASWTRAELADRRQRRTRRGARRQLGLDRGGGRRQGQGESPGQGRRGLTSRDLAGDPRQRAGLDADPRLSGARPSARQPRSPGTRAARRPRGTASVPLRLHGRRSRPPDLPRQRARPRVRHRPRDRRHPGAHVLPDARRRVHAYRRSRREGVDPGAASRGRTRRSPSRARASAPSFRSSSRPRVSKNSSI